MKFDLFLMCILPFLFCKPAGDPTPKENDANIRVSLKIDGKEIDISNSYSVGFISDGQSYFGFVEDRYLTLPHLPENIEFVSVIFNYGTYRLHFPKVSLDLIHYPGTIKWVFRIVYPPFNETRIKDIEVNKPSKIYYFGFSPDEGQGIEVFEPIYEE